MFDILYTEAAIQMFCNFIEITLRHGCSPVKLLHILRTSFLKNAAASANNYRLYVKFSTHMINSTREKIMFICTNCFRSIVALVFALATALSKFRFRSPKNKTINLVLVIKYHFNCWLQFDVNKKSIFQGFTKILIIVRATTWHNFLLSDQLLLGNLWVQ